jgi:hypothetical protein
MMLKKAIRLAALVSAGMVMGGGCNFGGGSTWIWVGLGAAALLLLSGGLST